MDDVTTAVGGPLAPVHAAGRLSLLHCTSSYPLRRADANLRAIATLGAAFPACVVGYSDHTIDCLVIPALAVAQGACLYEKHFRLADGLASPDTDHSLDPDEFACMVKILRGVSEWLGDGVKRPQTSEAHDVLWTRRSPQDWHRPTDAARSGRWA